MSEEGIQGQRIRKNKGHESIRREALQDDRLSFKATGMLAYLLSLPDNWTTDAKRLAGAKNGTGKAREGRDAIQSGLRELEDAGYLVRRKYQDDKGRWRWIWKYSDNPADLDDLRVSAGQTVNGLPGDGVSGAGSAGAGSPGDLEVLEVEVLEKRKNTTSKTSTSSSPAAPSDGLFAELDAPSKPASPAAVEALFEEFWTAYPRKTDKKKARDAWGRKVKANDPRELINAAARYAQSRRGEDPRFTAHPSTWLNGERWNDEPVYARVGGVKAHQTVVDQSEYDEPW